MPINCCSISAGKLVNQGISASWPDVKIEKTNMLSDYGAVSHEILNIDFVASFLEAGFDHAALFCFVGRRDIVYCLRLCLLEVLRNQRRQGKLPWMVPGEAGCYQDCYQFLEKEALCPRANCASTLLPCVSYSDTASKRLVVESIQPGDAVPTTARRTPVLQRHNKAPNLQAPLSRCSSFQALGKRQKKGVPEIHGPVPPPSGSAISSPVAGREDRWLGAAGSPRGNFSAIR